MLNHPDPYVAEGCLLCLGILGRGKGSDLNGEIKKDISLIATLIESREFRVYRAALRALRLLAYDLFATGNVDNDQVCQRWNAAWDQLLAESNHLKTFCRR